MTAIQPAGAAGLLTRYEALRAKLPGDAGVRAAAAARFRDVGLPGRRDEAWKYTDLRALATASFQEPLSSVAGEQMLDRVPRVANARLVFVNGRYRPELSDEGVHAAIRVTRFSENPDLDDLGRVGETALVALNTMLAEDGVVIEVPEDIDAGTLHIASIGDGAPGATIGFHPRHVVRLGRNARLTIVETATGTGNYLHNAVAELRLASGAALSMVRLQDESREAFHFSTYVAEIAEGATLDCFVLALGARLARTEIHAWLKGPGGRANLAAAQLLAGAQHADVTTVVRHEAPSCASRQTVKNVLTGRSRGVFQGRIEVARLAQKTDGYQMSQALLLSPDAEVDTKPELEIFADDVKCSHGATVGELDADQMFYLRSRGVPEAEARAILVRAFLNEALETVADASARTALDAAVEAWWRKEAP